MEGKDKGKNDKETGSSRPSTPESDVDADSTQDSNHNQPNPAEDAPRARTTNPYSLFGSSPSRNQLYDSMQHTSTANPSGSHEVNQNFRRLNPITSLIENTIENSMASRWHQSQELDDSDMRLRLQSTLGAAQNCANLLGEYYQESYGRAAQDTDQTTHPDLDSNTGNQNQTPGCDNHLRLSNLSVGPALDSNNANQTYQNPPQSSDNLLGLSNLSIGLDLDSNNANRIYQNPTQSSDNLRGLSNLSIGPTLDSNNANRTYQNPPQSSDNLRGLSNLSIGPALDSNNANRTYQNPSQSSDSLLGLSNLSIGLDLDSNNANQTYQNPPQSSDNLLGLSNLAIGLDLDSDNGNQSPPLSRKHLLGLADLNSVENENFQHQGEVQRYEFSTDTLGYQGDNPEAHREVPADAASQNPDADGYRPAHSYSFGEDYIHDFIRNNNPEFEINNPHLEPEESSSDSLGSREDIDALVEQEQEYQQIMTNSLHTSEAEGEESTPPLPESSETRSVRPRVRSTSSSHNSPQIESQGESSMASTSSSSVNTGYLYYCHPCNISFSEFFRYQCHLNEHADNYTRIHCIICNTTIPTLHEYVLHRNECKPKTGSPKDN